ncbi:oligosaccharide flippase family protein [Candidatus Lokiarchaeum ossiferum]|uniref:oligosaccharide flippase family protein n=1 Tax=Candidatus Lokiarchaeum ossiferum TaxID=2951803 RepID=UPI00352E6231
MSIENEDQDLHSKIYNSIFLLSISKAVSQFLFFIMRYIFVISWLSIEEYANLIIFDRYLGLIQSLIIIGPFILQKFIPENKIPLQKLLSNVFVIISINLIISIIFFVIYFSFIPAETSILKTSSLFSILIYIGVIFLIAQKQFEFFYLGLKKPKIVLVATLVWGVSYFILTIISVAIFDLGYTGAILSYILAHVVSFLFEFVIFQKNFSFKLEWKLDKEISKTILKYSVPLFLSGVLYYFNFRINSLFINEVDIHLLVFYDTGVSFIINLIAFIGAPVQEAIFPFMTKSISEKNSLNSQQIFGDTTKIVSFFFLNILLVFYVMVEFVYSILYPDFTDPLFIEISKILIIGAFFYIVNQLFSRIITAEGSSHLNLISQMIGAGINLICLIIYLQTQILAILLLGFILSCMGMAIFDLFFVIKIIHFKLLSTKFIQQILAFFTTLACIYMLELVSLHFTLIILISVILFNGQLILYRILFVEDFINLFQFLRELVKKPK